MKKLLFFTLIIATIIFYISFNYSLDYSSKNKNFIENSFLAKQKRKANSALGYAEWRNDLTKNNITGKVNPRDYYKALNQADILKYQSQSNKTNGPLALEWVSRGPDSQGGRTRAILVDKDNERLVFTGGISGGLWKSTDGAQNWERVSGWEGNNSAIMSISQTINGTLFVGTGESLVGFLPNGESFNSNITGNGIYKSNDLGESWVHINQTDEFSYPTFTGEWASVNMMSTHPSNTNLMIAANKFGLRISVNAESAQPTFTNINGVNGLATDVQFTSDGTDVWGAVDGAVYKSSDLINNFTSWSQNSPINSNRAQLAISTVDANGNYIVYASFTDDLGCMVGVWKTEDKGINWTQIIFPNTGLDPFASPLGGGACQGWYDHCLAVNPADKNKIYIGGITFYTWGSGSGGMKRADQLDSSGETASILDPNYMHADKHFIKFNQHDQTGNTMYITGDGGINKCVNANAGFPDNLVYTQNNKNYTTLQCYSIGSGKYGEVIAGAQDNGTQYVNYKGISPKAAIEVYGGDGQAGAEISNLSPDILFAGYQFGLLTRSLNNGETATPFTDTIIDPAGCFFQTCSEIVQGSGTTCDDKEGEGQDFIYSFYLMETHEKLTTKKDIYVYARDEEIILPSGNIQYIKDTIFPGDVTDLIVNSKIPDLDLNGLGLNFILPQDSTLFPGDTFYFNNNFEAKYFVKSNCGSNLFVCTNPLQKGTAPRFSAVPIASQSGIKRLDSSADGDLLAAVSGNRVIIMQGWDAYDPDVVPSSVTNVQVNLSGIGAGALSGISVNKSNKNHVLVSESGYGSSSKVFVSFNATDSFPTFVNIHNNLPEMPIYSCLIDKANPNRYILGTELGIWATNDAGVTWFEENDGIGGRVPIFAVRQHWMNNFDCNLISAGSLGAGMFTCTTLMDCANKTDLVWGRPSDATPDYSFDEDLYNVSIYPNPVLNNAKLAFFLNKPADVTVKIINITGKIVSQRIFKDLNEGDQILEYDMSNLASSTYFAIVSIDGLRYNNRLFIKK